MKNLYAQLLSTQRCFSLCFSLLTTIAAGAQAPAWDGATAGTVGQAIGGSHIQAVAADASGNVFVTGSFTGTVAFGGTTLISASGDDIFVAKYVPATRTWAWAQRGGGNNADAGFGIAVSNNSVYVVGTFFNSSSNANNVSFGGATPGTSPVTIVGNNSVASENLVLAKYTDQGTSATLTWTQTGGGYAEGYGVAVSGNSVYVVGSLYNNTGNTFGALFGGTGTVPGTAPVYGASPVSSRDLLLAKYTDYGPLATLDWTQVGGGTDADYGRGVAVSGNNVYVVGIGYNNRSNANAVVFGGSGATAGTSPQAGASSTIGYDILLVKYQNNGSSGTYRWSQVGGGTGDDGVLGVAVSGTSVYIAGSVFNSTTNANNVVFGGNGLAAGTSVVSGATTTASSDLLLAKYQDNGASGNFQWSQVGGGTSNEGGSAVAVSGNQVYVTGVITNTVSNSKAVVFGGTNPVAGIGSTVGQDVVLAKYTDNGSTGAYAWSRVGGGEEFDSGNGLALSGQQVCVGGQTSPPSTFGPTTVSAPRLADLGVLAYLTDPTLTPLASRAASSQGSLSVYPNPARLTATLSGTVPGQVVQVLDVLGRLVATAPADATGTARLSGLPAGCYVVRAGLGSVLLRVE